MKVKKIPMRTCVITKEKCEKKDLLRIVRTPQKEILIDLKGKINGKGAYLKKDLDVVNKARQSKILNKILEVEVPDQIYDEILDILK